MNMRACLAPALYLAVLAGCAGEDLPPGDPRDEWDDKLNDRVVDYNAALRIAALRLTGDLPTLTEMMRVAEASDPKNDYESLVRSYMEGPRFARQMFKFWQDTMKMGGDPELDQPAAYLAHLVFDDRSYLEAFTGSTETCPTFDPITSKYTPGSCAPNGPNAGILNHRGPMRHFFSNFGFRRVRWIQETFVCTKFPAEIAEQPTDVGGVAPYTGKFPFTSIAGKATGGLVDFRDTSAVICANCHSNINHIAPLFATFTPEGTYAGQIVVPTPDSAKPVATLGDYLPPGERTAWRFGVPIDDLSSLGAAMAKDPDVAECAIARVWNWAMGKADIVDAEYRVPAATIEKHVADFTANGYRLKEAMFRVFTSDDFVRF